jgi:predicted Zn-dependent protease
MFILMAFSFTGCATLTGSKEPTDAEINAEAARAFEEVKAKSKLSTNREWSDMVQRVAHRIEVASGENFAWEAILIESPEINAWCMPGGKIAVYTGIMPVLKTEAALAAVLGHEVAHATLRHGKQRYARAIRSNALGALVGIGTAVAGQVLCKDVRCKTLSALGGAAAGFAIAFFDRKFSRQDETEADHTGQEYMAKAGYDPTEAILLWQRMSAASGGQAPPEWMSTHPSDARRKEALESWLPAAKQLYAQAPQQFGLGQAIQ